MGGSRQVVGALLGAHASIRTAAIALRGLRGLFVAASLSSGAGVPWCCRVVPRGAYRCMVLRLCPAWPAYGTRSLPGRAVVQAQGPTPSLTGP